MDFALRGVESIAFALHGLLGITDPCHGAVRYALRIEDSLPWQFVPAAGFMLLLVAAANFSGIDEVVLAAQAYIVAFHSGGAFFHVRLKHHPATPCAPGLFVMLAFAVLAMRLRIWIALLVTAACVVAGGIGVHLLVKQPSEDQLQLQPKTT